MTKFTLIIDGTEKIINLKESIVPKKASIFWNYNNVGNI